MVLIPKIIFPALKIINSTLQKLEEITVASCFKKEVEEKNRGTTK